MHARVRPPAVALTALLAVLLPVLLAVAGCSSDSADERVDAASARVDELADRLEALVDAEQAEATAQTSPPLPTLPPAGTAPPRTNPPTTPTTAAPTTAALPAVAAATRAQIEAKVAGAAWDATLPIPADCLAGATFQPAGEGGVNGGRLDCTSASSYEAVVAFYRGTLAAGGFSFTEEVGDTFARFLFGSVATVSIAASGAGSDLAIVQTYS